MLAHNAVVVVADGHSATLFRNVARTGIELSEIERVTLESLAHPQHGDQVPDIVPGSDDPGAFAARLADHVNAMVLTQKVEDVVIVADPATLGVLRKHYHKELQFRLRKEVAKNLVHADARTIEDALS